MELQLHQDVFPIRRYTQFEDALNRVSADPVASLLSVLAGRRGDAIEPSIAIVLRPARRRHRRRAEKCLQHLARPFFRTHHRLAHWYTDMALSPSWSCRVFGWLLARFAKGPAQHPVGLTVSSGRQHDREEDLQAAADKLGRHLFEARIHLRVTGPLILAAQLTASTTWKHGCRAGAPRENMAR